MTSLCYPKPAITQYRNWHFVYEYTLFHLGLQSNYIQRCFLLVGVCFRATRVVCYWSVMCFLGAVGPQRPAFLQKSLDSLLPITERQIVHHDSCGSGVRSISCLRHLPLKGRFSESHHGAARIADSACDGQRFFLQTLLAHHLTHQSV